MFASSRIPHSSQRCPPCAHPHPIHTPSTYLLAPLPPRQALIADFFFIVFALAWLGAGLAERSTLQSTALLDAWLPLWQWVFQPAIGVLMLGAVSCRRAGGLLGTLPRRWTRPHRWARPHR